MRISDWSSDVCSSDLRHSREEGRVRLPRLAVPQPRLRKRGWCASRSDSDFPMLVILHIIDNKFIRNHRLLVCAARLGWRREQGKPNGETRSEEHTSELQSLMRISYAVFCLKKKRKKTRQTIPIQSGNSNI